MLLCLSALLSLMSYIVFICTIIFELINDCDDDDDDDTRNLLFTIITHVQDAPHWCQCESSLTVGGLQVHYEEMIRTLAKRTEHIHTRLLRNMMDNHSEFLRSLSAEYEAIAEKLLTAPVDTADLMELIGRSQQQMFM